MDIGKAFSFVFDDERWVNKVLIGAVFSILSVVIIGVFFIMGYMVELIRNVANGNPRPLPEWDNLGAKLGRGFMLFVVFLVYAIPVFVIMLCTTIPATIIGSAGSDSNAAGGLAGLLSLVGSCLVFLYYILLFILAPAIVTRFAMTGSVGACFQFGQLISFITANTGNYVIALLLSIVASFIGGIGTILCFVGVFVTGFYSYLVMGHLYGQLYRQSVGGGQGFQTV